MKVDQKRWQKQRDLKDDARERKRRETERSRRKRPHSRQKKKNQETKLNVVVFNEARSLESSFFLIVYFIKYSSHPSVNHAGDGWRWPKIAEDGQMWPEMTGRMDRLAKHAYPRRTPRFTPIPIFFLSFVALSGTFLRRFWMFLSVSRPREGGRQLGAVPVQHIPLPCKFCENSASTMSLLLEG